jgi:hypothetical protein
MTSKNSWMSVVRSKDMDSFELRIAIHACMMKLRYKGYELRMTGWVQ